MRWEGLESSIANPFQAILLFGVYHSIDMSIHLPLLMRGRKQFQRIPEGMERYEKFHCW